MRLIADEWVGGLSRIGPQCATRSCGVRADLWRLAKGISSGYISSGATAMSGKLRGVFDEPVAALGTSVHRHSGSGHAVAAAAGLAALEVFEREEVVGSVARLGLRFLARLEVLLRVASQATQVACAAGRCGAMIRSCGSSLILSPTLTISRERFDLPSSALDGRFAAVPA
ncbi:MAG: aminotransferase class III-fold pyridoxal phosphate-dependent enzyme [Gammaproteobacteria bacterium]|nr:aminotransferase class III-fold pyridoxal phosphate-dependent enzyme [Gammaproteobacteria bacterium]